MRALKRAGGWFTVVICGVAACGPAVAEEEGRLAGRILAHVEFLADDALRGRETGTREYEIAARYVASQFSILGLEPAGTDGWLQPVPLRTKQLVEDSAEAILHTADGDLELEFLHDFTMGGDASLAESEVTAPVVFAGWGITAPGLDHQDYEGLDVEGRIVLMFSGAPARFPADQRAYYSRGKTEEAARRGAVGILTLQTTEERARVPWESSIRNPYRKGMLWINDAGEAQESYPEIRGGAALSPQGAEKLLAAAGLPIDELLEAASEDEATAVELPLSVTLRRRTRHEEITAPNVVAMLPGSDPAVAHEAVVFTAHLDHVGVGKAKNGDEIYNGAYDNAMGVAALLETARLFTDSGERPRRSILFVALAGEEKGLLGAKYFVDAPPVPRDDIVANVNLDMPLFLYPLADVVAFGAEHSSLGEDVAAATAQYGWKVSPDPMPEQVIFVRSDQYAFVRKGIPAVFLVSGFGSLDPEVDGRAVWRSFFSEHYHTPSDDLELPFHAPSAERFTRVNHEIGRRLATQTERPTWNPGDFFGELFAGEAGAEAAP